MNHGPKYIITITKADGTPIPHNEPLFILRAQDKLAVRTVQYYAKLLAQQVGENNEELKHILGHAAEMDAWPIKKLPD